MKKIFNSRHVFSFMSTVLLVLTILTTVVLFGVLKINDLSVSAATTTFTVNKNVAVDVYVYGEDVEYDVENSNLLIDTYIVEVGSTVYLRAVNDTELFNGWTIINNGTTTKPTTAYTSVSVEGEVSVSLSSVAPSGFSRGHLKYDMIPVTEASHLIAIQKILDFGKNTLTNEIVEEYGKLFGTNDYYRDAADKAKFINDNNLFDVVQNGYYGINNNLSVFGDEFVGIGNETYPFKGVFVGTDEGTSIISTISATEKGGNNYYGLFSILEKEAVLLNLSLSTSIGIEKAGSSVSNGVIYAGGVAGKFNNAFMNNCEVKAIMSITSGYSTVYAGGIAGHMSGGLNAINECTYDGSSTGWIITNNSDKNNFIGYIAGYTDGAYLKDFNLNVTNADIMISSSSDDTSSSVSLGTLFGYYNGTRTSEISNVKINSISSSKLQSIVNYGNSYVGGAIGYVNATNELEIGDINFTNSSEYKSKYISQSFDKNSHANVYVGGLFAVTSGTVKASDEFKTNIKNIAIDDKIIKRGEYIFSGNYCFEAINNGFIDNSTYGKCIAGGLVGKGYFDILGISGNNSQILINDGKGLFEVVATQSQTAESQNYNTAKGDIEHLIASLVFGIISNSSNDIDVNYIDVYATNTIVNAIRENGSKAMGDVRVAGFNGFSNETSYDDINLYINDSNFLLESLSYVVKNNYSDSDSNNAYCGGLFAEVEGGSATSTVSVKNSKIAGYNETDFTEVGTTLKIKSTQNSQAPGGKDFVDENYTGGLIGHIYRVNTVSGMTYYGSETNEDYVIQQGHENPDSAFCGGIIGLVKQIGAYSNTVNITDCKVKNATVEVYATNINDFASPDIMLGGIVGASYINENITTNYTNLYVYNSQIHAYAYEDMETNVAGIVGALTWDGSQTISNCYVFGSSISGVSSTTSAAEHDKDAAYASGILAHGYNITPKIYNCAVIDSDVIARGERTGYVYATGLYRRRSGGQTPTFFNCYINSTIEGYVNNTLSNSSSYVVANHGSSSNTVSISSTNYTDYLYYTSNLKNTQINASNTNNIESVSINDLKVDGTVNLNTIITYNKGTKVYPVLRNGTEFSIANAGTTGEVSITKTGTGDYSTDVMDLWINANPNGVAGQNPSSLSPEEAHDNGWFLLASINVYSGEYDKTNIDDISDDIEIIYTDGTNNYLFDKEDAGGKRYLKHILDASVLVRSGYLESTITDQTVKLGSNTFNLIKEIDINVYEGIHSMNIDFSVNEKPLYNIVLLDSNGNIINKNPNNLDNYGTYDYTYVIDGNNTNYSLNYYPNPEMSGNSDISFYIAFQVGTSTNTVYDLSVIKVTLSPNVRTLIGAKPADYSPSLNIRDAIVGTLSNPYLLEVGSITKFVPVFIRSNDIEYKEYFDDINVEYVTYSTNAGNYATARSNGELKIETYSASTYEIVLTSKVNTSEKITVYFKSAVVNTVYNVTYTATGADLSSIGKASREADFYFDLDIYSSYSSVLNRMDGLNRKDALIIKIGGTQYNDYRLIADGAEIVAGTEKPKPLAGREDVSKYTVIIPAAAVTGNIDITINLDVVYDVTFVLNCSKFNTEYHGPVTKTYKVLAGDSLATYFKDTIDTGENIDIINQWVNDATLFGYAFNGFYLVDNADSLPAYGYDLTTLVANNAKVNTSLTFYGCWSFLIELIEAPGTHIVTSFADSFMKDYYVADKVTDTIKIPINSNRGYIFTITKDEGFIGEAEVRAFALTKHDENIITDEIVVEKYHENQYLYYIPPEAIKGYLVIATSVGNSEIIVGENSASVTEELLPQDGVYTFKYVINHRNTASEKSFIYNTGIDGNEDGNLDYNRDIMLEFFEQTFNGSNLGEKARYLEKGTVIEVYYQMFVNGSITNQVIGSYIVDDNNTARVFLKDFTLINNDSSTKAFEEITFRDLLAGNENSSEVYYFSITPPNGSTLDSNKIINYLVNCGYYYNDSGNYRYIEGERSTKEFVNIPIQGQLDVMIMHESAMHRNIYSVSPSRITNVDVKDSENLIFNFQDITKYNILNLTLTNTVTTGADYIKLSGTIGSRSELISSELGFYIKDIKFTAGYNKGDINIYGSNDGTTWNIVDTISVKSEEYAEYTSKFTTNYRYFKLDNVSGNDIHISKLSVSDLQTAIDYEIEFLSSNQPAVSGNTHTYSLTNEIVGDSRHDGKKFMLAVQIYNASSKIVESLDTSIHLLVNGTKYYPNDADALGKSVMYFNLTDILTALGTDQFDFQLVLPAEYANYEVVTQLLEAKLSLKPAMGEVRETISLITKANITYNYVYVGGASSSGSVTHTNPLIISGDTMLVAAVDGTLVFGGWYIDEELTRQVSSVSLADGNTTLYGAFYPAGTVIYKATFSVDSVAISDVILPAGGNIVVPELPSMYEKTGYTFVGWSDGVNTYTANSVIAMPNANTTYNAVYKVNKYTISFDTTGGDLVQSITLDYGAAITTMVPNPERTGYEFAGWDQELPATMPAYDMVIKANWNPHTYIIRFDANGASGTMADQAMTYGQTKQLNANAYTMPGYAFVGWAVDSTGDPVYADKAAVSNLTPENGDVFTLYARWKPVLTISFETNGGTIISPIHVLYDEYLEKPATPYKEGHSFVGWYTDSTLQNEFDFENTKVQSSYTLYAKWQINQYTITFKDGDSVLGSITGDYGSAVNATSVPVLSGTNGYIVTWDSIVPTTIPSSDLTINKVSVKLTYDLNGGATTNNNPTSYVYGSTVNNLSDPTGLTTGYLFHSWEYNGSTITNLNQIVLSGDETEVIVKAKYYVSVTITNNVYFWFFGTTYYDINMTASSSNGKLYNTSLNELDNPFSTTVAKEGGTYMFYVAQGSIISVSATYNSTNNANGGINGETINAPTSITFTRD